MDAVRSDEDGRLVDTLLVGAIIEARSCERFAAHGLDPRQRLASSIITAQVRGSALSGLSLSREFAARLMSSNDLSIS